VRSGRLAYIMAEVSNVLREAEGPLVVVLTIGLQGTEATVIRLRLVELSKLLKA